MVGLSAGRMQSLLLVAVCGLAALQVVSWAGLAARQSGHEQQLLSLSQRADVQLKHSSDLLSALQAVQRTLEQHRHTAKLMHDTVAALHKAIAEAPRSSPPAAAHSPLDNLPQITTETPPVRIAISLSTMRRGLQEEHVFATIESLLPFLGREGRVRSHVVAVDVERGSGEFGRQIGERFAEQQRSGLLKVRHLDDASRATLYRDLMQTCALHRLYGDDLTRTIWRSKRVLDFVFSVRAATEDADYVLVLEDDTPILGSYIHAIGQCLSLYPEGSSTACRWDFHWERKIALEKVVPPDHSLARSSPKLMYPQGNLQGLFAMMLPVKDWLSICDYMSQHFDKAPADWLVGRWLFVNNWRIAFLPPLMAVYHRQGTSFADSSRLAVSKSLANDPLFGGHALDWNDCPRDNPAFNNHPFKWEENPARWRLRWVGGNDLFLELPWTDITGHDIGAPRDAALMDEDARIIVCEMIPNCKAVNLNGWMKKDLDVRAVPPPDRNKKLYIRVSLKAPQEELNAIKTFFLECFSKLPENQLGLNKA